MTSPHRPVWWVPTLYFAQGLPYAVVTSLATLALLALGWAPEQAALYTSGLTLPWVIKPLWGPLVERWGARRAWIVAMQAAGAVLLVALSLTLPEKSLLPWTLGLLTAAAFASATHDIAADGFYIVALDPHAQAAWSGVRNTFFRVALLAGGSGLVVLAGEMEKTHGAPAAWQTAFATGAALLGIVACYHFVILPRPEADTPAGRGVALGAEFAQTWASFVRRPGFARMLAFMLFYRIGEGQLLKGNQAFLLAAPAAGGLGLSVETIGFLSGLGVIALLAGGILGGVAIARTGLRRQLWPMACAINLPHLIYVWLAWARPENRVLLSAAIGVEQFGYGYGFAAYMVYLLYVSRGEHPTAHYALCSGVMALGLMLAGYAAAAALAVLHDDYLRFFLWVTACSVLSFGTLWHLPLADDFGRRAKSPTSPP
jgi:PAT family beta-lactamase induction signal transducer AmpG